MKRIGIVLLIPALFALFIVACAGTAPNILHVQANPMGVSAKHIEINDKYLGRNISFGDVSIKPIDTGSSFEAQVLLTNESANDLAFEYRFIWYDAKGYDISPITSWLPGMLSAKETKGLKSSSPGPEAAGFRFMVRMPHPVTGTGS